jgi:hypothetical protein
MERWSDGAMERWSDGAMRPDLSIIAPGPVDSEMPLDVASNRVTDGSSSLGGACPSRSQGRGTLRRSSTPESGSISFFVCESFSLV